MPEVPVPQRIRETINSPRSTRETPASAATDRGRGPTTEESNVTKRTANCDGPGR